MSMSMLALSPHLSISGCGMPGGRTSHLCGSPSALLSSDWLLHFSLRFLCPPSQLITPSLRCSPRFLSSFIAPSQVGWFHLILFFSFLFFSSFCPIQLCVKGFLPFWKSEIFCHKCSMQLVLHVIFSSCVCELHVLLLHHLDPRPKNYFKGINGTPFFVWSKFTL